MKHINHSFSVFNRFLLGAALAFSAGSVSAAQPFISTGAYCWVGDSIIQGDFKAWAVSDNEIRSTYHAQPHYFMPVNQTWQLKNDISSYPRLKTSNRLHSAIYNMGLDEMVNNVEPDTTLRTGKEWAGVWTRDVSYSIILSMAYLQPEASRISLMKKVNERGQIIQDTGSGGAWPVSSDRMIWSVAAYELYKVTGDKDWLSYIYNVIKTSFESDFSVTHDENSLVKGETSFIDWREQSYPRWMQTADIYNSRAMGTSVVHASALNILAQAARELGKKKEADEYSARAAQLCQAINNTYWMSDKGYYAMYTYGRDHQILNPRAETLGESLAILFGIADSDRARAITENNPTTNYGPAIFFPQIADMPSYHNNALWPFVASYWAMANARARNEQGTLEAIGSVFRPAALFATNKENFVLDNGDIATELNSSNMLWSLSGNIAITHKILFGINFEANGLSFKPFVPKALADERTLQGFKYRNATLDITVSGHGDSIARFTVNGKAQKPFIPANIKGHNVIRIELANNDLPALKVNRQANVKAPLTPIARLSNDPTLNGENVPVNNLLTWNPIEYIAYYKVLRDGQVVESTRRTSFAATERGEYQVIGVSDKGVESFASEPLSNCESFVYEFDNEKTSLASAEVSYRPSQPLDGWHGAGFVETDMTSAPVSVSIDVPAGEYAVHFSYANGNGPVNTENKCAIRTLKVDNSAVGTIVMPQRGVANWNDWGDTNHVITSLSAGRHSLSLSFEAHDYNMNLKTNHAIIDRIILTRLK